MIKKNLSEKDKKDWKNFLENISELPNKEIERNTSKPRSFKFDFHGYSINDANNKIYEIINLCYEKGISEILVVTGKGMHSKSEDNVYISKDFSKLKFTIPDFIKNNDDLNHKVSKISHAEKKLGGEGALLIQLKKL